MESLCIHADAEDAIAVTEDVKKDAEADVREDIAININHPAT